MKESTKQRALAICELLRVSLLSVFEPNLKSIHDCATYQTWL